MTQPVSQLARPGKERDVSPEDGGRAIHAIVMAALTAVLGNEAASKLPSNRNLLESALDPVTFAELIATIEKLGGMTDNAQSQFDGLTIDALIDLVTVSAPQSTPATCFFAASAAGDALSHRMAAVLDRVANVKTSDSYFYSQAVTALDGAFVRTEGARKSMFSSYNYLGLLGDPRIEQSSVAAIQRLGTGTHGSRLLGGTTDLHNALEHAVAHFVGREDSIVFTSGFMANYATLTTVLREDDWVFLDRANHASLIDGCIASRATVRRFRHNDANHLDSLLARAPKGVLKLVVADAIFSMDGDILDLPGVVAACHRHSALLMVDEAHSFGVLGANGRGIEEHFGMPGSIDILMGTLSKAIPASGGFIAGTGQFIEFLRFAARGYVFSGSTAPPLAAAALTALDIVGAEGAQRRAKLNRNSEHLRARLRDAGLPIGPCCTAIVPVILGSDEAALSMTRFCQHRGLFVFPVMPPAVPPGTARLRLTVTAAHSSMDIEHAADIIVGCPRDDGSSRPFRGPRAVEV